MDAKIVSVAAHFILDDIVESNVASATSIWTQNFQVAFVQKASPLPFNSYPRSGNPGYIPGKPVLAGKLNATNFIVMSSDPGKWKKKIPLKI